MEPAAMKVGVLLPIWTDSLDGQTPALAQALAFARHAEAVGLDSVWLTDHLYWEAFADFRAVGIELPAELEGVKGGQWECWTTAAALAVQTARIAIGTLVSNTTFRNPALLARMADNVMELSDGRLILGLGAGDFASEHHAYGFDFERHVGRFENALAIIKPLLAGARFSHAGEFHGVVDAALLPKSRAGTPPVLIGTLKGKPRMSRLVAEHADMWNCMIAFGDCARQLYAEIASIEEQHVTQYESIIDPRESWLEKWLLHEANEVYNYYGFVQQETNPRLKALWERFLDYELGHLDLVTQLFKEHERRDPAEVLPDTLPEPIPFASQREFVRKTLRAEAELRAAGTQIVDKEHESRDSLAYRRQLNSAGSPSETAAAGYQWSPGTELERKVANI